VTATALGLRDGRLTRGHLLRAGIAYQWGSGWRLALEQQPAAWGPGLTGGDLLGDTARAFPRLSLSTREASLPFGRWRAEAFAGQLEADRPIPVWISAREARSAAQAGGLDLRRARLYGGMLRASFGTLVEAGLGSLRLGDGETATGQAAPASAARTMTMAELKVRIPALARLAGARGAAIHLARSAAPDSRPVSLVPARTLGGLQLVWEGWDLGLEYAGAAAPGPSTFSQPAYLAGFSTSGDPLGPAFGREVITRTVDLGLPLFLEGQGRVRAVRGTSASPLGSGFWFLQGEAQWRTPTGRLGATVASRKDEVPGSPARWGWAFSVFQSFRVF
jgi:hypothetical protein